MRDPWLTRVMGTANSSVIFGCLTRYHTYGKLAIWLSVMKLEYHIVDVFTRNPLEGNALAVFLNGQGLSDSMMQKIAKELNLSETTFVLPSSLQGCDCR